MTTFMDYYSYATMEYIAEKEMELINKIKKYFADNSEMIIAGLAGLSGNYYPVIFK